MEFDYQRIAPDGTAIQGTDAQLLVKFYKHPVISKIKSDEAGAPMFDDVEMVHVITPGENNPIDVMATDWHRHRFAKQYDLFKKGIEQSQSGTPLEMLFPSEPSTILALKTFHVYTVQQLANITDSAMGQIPMGRTLVDRARAYLSAAAGGQNFHTTVNAMQKQIDELKALLGDKADSLPPAPAVNLPPEQLPKRKYTRRNKEIPNVTG